MRGLEITEVAGRVRCETVGGMGDDVSYSLDHVQLAFPAGAEDDADAFYVGVLGFSVLPKPPALAARGGRWYQSGSMQLHLGAERDFRASAKAHVALRTTGYDALRARLAAHGARVEDDDEIENVTRFYTWDPFGNRLEVIEGAVHDPTPSPSV